MRLPLQFWEIFVGKCKKSLKLAHKWQFPPFFRLNYTIHRQFSKTGGGDSLFFSLQMNHMWSKLITTKNFYKQFYGIKLFTQKVPKVWHFWGNYALNYSAKADKPSQEIICKKLQGQYSCNIQKITNVQEVLNFIPSNQV